ncbi:hypothetical protein [Leucobacter massiliensis]|uniref:hypothetical protein n=1 Tax=Leucobacter massiliensis TaxID=1686285 RepID=UPI001FE67AA5|nr:hypothetical protein [Leucobacter massiliensis]
MRRDPAQELHAELALEPPLDSTEQLAFACMSLAERMLSGLTRDRLVCTALRVELTDDIGVRHERVWSHPRHFTAPDVVNRIRWQASAISAPSGAAGAPDGDGRESAGIAHVRLVPVHTDRAAAHEPGLWSTEPDERVHHHLSRAQSRLGHSGVGTQELRGGRLLAERQRFAPWGTEAPRDSPSTAAGPWPGALPGPKPSSVFPQPIPARLSDAAGRPVHVDDEDRLSADPARLGIDGTTLHAPALGWSRPWAIRERWWRGTPARFRLQLQLEDGDAWLLLYSGGEWFAEGHYD